MDNSGHPPLGIPDTPRSQHHTQLTSPEPTPPRNHHRKEILTTPTRNCGHPPLVTRIDTALLNLLTNQLPNLPFREPGIIPLSSNLLTQRRNRLT